MDLMQLKDLEKLHVAFLHYVIPSQLKVSPFTVGIRSGLM